MRYAYAWYLIDFDINHSVAWDSDALVCIIYV